MVLPGVGRLTAMTLVAEIGDIDRFPTARKLCAWPGCPTAATPTATSAMATSPSRARPGGAGSCKRPPHTAKPSPQFAGTYGQLARRRGTQIATVAIARRLLARCFHILKEVQTATTTGEGQTGRARASA